MQEYTAQIISSLVNKWKDFSTTSAPKTYSATEPLEFNQITLSFSKAETARSTIFCDQPKINKTCYAHYDKVNIGQRKKNMETRLEERIEDAVFGEKKGNDRHIIYMVLIHPSVGYRASTTLMRHRSWLPEIHFSLPTIFQDAHSSDTLGKWIQLHAISCKRGTYPLSLLPSDHSAHECQAVRRPSF